MSNSELISCKCGCGKKKKLLDNNGNERYYIHGHNWRGKSRKPFTEEHRKKIKLARAKQVITSKTREKISKALKIKYLGEGNPMWRGGRVKNNCGYIMIKKHSHPMKNVHGYVSEHRLVMEEHLGRYLTKDEVVHHIDGVRDNNYIDNLMLFPNNSEHVKHHGFGK